MTTIKGILFDKDGVIVDFDRTWAPALKAIARQLADGDAAREAEYLRVAGYDAGADAFAAGSIWAAGNTRDLVQVWLPQGSDSERAAMAHHVDSYCASCEAVPLLPIAELQQIFAALKGRGLALGIATNDSEASAKHTMGLFGLLDALDLVMGYDTVSAPKPAADPMLLFASHTGHGVSSLAMVGDNLHDADMARAAGAGLAIGVLSGNSSHEELAPLVDHTIDSIADLEALVDTLCR